MLTPPLVGVPVSGAWANTDDERERSTRLRFLQHNSAERHGRKSRLAGASSKAGCDLLLTSLMAALPLGV